MASVGPQIVTVFGGGSFGTALATCLARNGHNVTILTRNLDVANSINTKHVNPDVLSSFTLSDNIKATTDPAEALKNVQFIVHAVPVQHSLDYLTKLKDSIPPDVVIVNASKGIHSTTLQYMTTVIPNALGRNQPIAIFSGPSFAKELMEGQPTTVVAASADIKIAEHVQKLFSSTVLRVYTTDDVVGVEVSGALKNIFAIAAGILDGLGLGMNSMAGLVTRGCNEMTKLAVAMGARPATVAGLSGIGDLMLTCYGSLSRNRSVGRRLGQGEQINDIINSMNEVAEGVPTSAAAVKLAEKYGLDLPIVKAVNRIIDGKQTPRDAVIELMNLPLRGEHE